ncbi:MAG TPA: polysaccharide deacetylase family protein, partial [Pseudomonadota bacterium]|nr:polysaccharide deacetylase family protein [Pseudomonadota bacterium]
MTEPLRVAITIDVEHDCPPFMQSCRGMEEGMPRLLDLFAADSIPVTFFTTGDMARRFPQIVERIVGDGHELGCHGDTHKRFSAMLPDEAQREIESASATLRRSTEVVSFRAPNLDLPEAYLPLLSAAGYAVDSSRGRHKLTHRTFKRAIRDPPRQGLGLSGALRAADKSDYVT